MGMGRMTFPTPFVRPSLKRSRVPGLIYSGCLRNLNRTLERSPVRKTSFSISTFLNFCLISELEKEKRKEEKKKRIKEEESGRTSSISHEIMGFTSKGEICNYSSTHKIDWTEVCQASSKVVTFIDLCGHEKYLKTTVFGLTGCSPDFVMLMVFFFLFFFFVILFIYISHFFCVISHFSSYYIFVF